MTGEMYYTVGIRMALEAGKYRQTDPMPGEEISIYCALTTRSIQCHMTVREL